MIENEKTILYQMLSQIIKGNQLTETEEAELRKILEDKEKKEEENKICLAAIIEKELGKAIKSGQICEANVELYQSVFKECFEKSEIGNMPAAALSDMLIRKFVLQVGKTYEMDIRKIKCFTGMLQVGLNKMAEEDILDFVPEKHIYKNYLMCPNRGFDTSTIHILSGKQKKSKNG